MSRYLKILFQCASWLGISQDILVNKTMAEIKRHLANQSLATYFEHTKFAPFRWGKFDFCYSWCLNKSNNRKKLQSFLTPRSARSVGLMRRNCYCDAFSSHFFRAALRFFKHHRPFPSRVLCHRLPLLFYLVPVRVSPLMIKVKKKYKKLWARLSLNKYYKTWRKLRRNAFSAGFLHRPTT